MVAATKNIISLSLSIIVGCFFLFSPFDIWTYIALLFLATSFSAINPEIGIYLILFAIPFSKKVEIQNVLVSTTDIVFLASFTGFVINRALYKRRIIFKTSSIIPFSLFIFFLILSIIDAEGVFAGFRQFIKYFEMLLFFILLINIIDSKERLYRFVWFSVVIASLVSATRITGFIYKPSRHFFNKLFTFRLYNSFFNNLNLEAAYTNFIIFFPFLIYLTSDKFLKRFLSLFVFLILLIPELFLFSRGGLIGFVGGLLVIIYLSTRYTSKSLLLKNLLILISIITLLVNYSYKKFLDERVLDKLNSTHSIFNNVVKKGIITEENLGLDKRIKLVRLALKNIKEHPFLGIGAGNYIYLYFGPQYLGKDEMPGIHHVHNLYLQIWMEMGVFALIAYLWLIFCYFRSALHVLGRNKHLFLLTLGSLGAITSFSIHSLMDFVFLHHIQLLFIFMLAVPFIITKEANPVRPYKI